MPDDPALVYRGVETTSQDILVILFSGAAVTVRGVMVHFETSAGEAAAPFADSGPVGWIAYDGDESQIEFAQYLEAATGQAVHRRIIKAQRVSSRYSTVKLNMSVEGTVIARRGSFSPLDFSSLDFDTGTPP